MRIYDPRKQNQSHKVLRKCKFFILYVKEQTCRENLRNFLKVTELKVTDLQIWDQNSFLLIPVSLFFPPNQMMLFYLCPHSYFLHTFQIIYSQLRRLSAVSLFSNCWSTCLYFQSLAVTTKWSDSIMYENLWMMLIHNFIVIKIKGVIMEMFTEE